MRRLLVAAALLLFAAGSEAQNINYYPGGLTGVTATASAFTLTTPISGTSASFSGAVAGASANFVGPLGLGNTTAAPYAYLYAPAANTLALRNSTNAQTFHIYNTYTDGSNYERLAIVGGTSLSLLTQKSGTGAQLPLTFGATGSANWAIRATTAGDTPAGSFYPIGGDDSVDVGQYNVRVRNIQMTRSIQGSKTKALTESSATAAWDCALAAGAHTGGTLNYCVYAADATDQQERCASIKVSAVNKAGTTTCVMSPGTVNETTDGNAGALSAGTLTYAVTCTDTTDSFGILFNAVSSLTQTTLQSESRWDIMSPAVCTPQ